MSTLVAALSSGIGGAIGAGIILCFLDRKVNRTRREMEELRLRVTRAEDTAGAALLGLARMGDEEA